MERPSTQGSWLGLGLLGAAAAGTMLFNATTDRRGARSLWYRALRKPTVRPRVRTFVPVWAGLYGLMVGSGWLVLRARDGERGRGAALALWGGQLALSAGWSYLFFRRRQPRLALADLGLMAVAATAYAGLAYGVDRRAAWMTVPYLGWLGVAGWINADVVRKNPMLTNGASHWLP
jgi:tryptophan-rich sensory protein